MTESTDAGPTEGGQQPPRKRGGLSTMLLADLKAMAASMNIDGSAGMRKAQLVEAIRAAQTGGAGSGSPQAREQASPSSGAEPSRGHRDENKQDQAKQDQAKQDQAKQDKGKQSGQNKQDRGKQDQGKQGGQNKQDQNKQGGPANGRGSSNQNNQASPSSNAQSPGDGSNEQDDDEAGSRRNRRRRGRERPDNRGGRARNEPDTTILEDDVLVPAAGIVDVLENYAFVRTSGYLAGADDVYLSLSLVRKHGLRRGDAVVGQVRQPREGERREKFNPMVRVDNVNGAEPDGARSRPEFDALTPVSPAQRLRLETAADALVGRTVDLVAPVGKGQRGLVVAPPRAGKTTVLQAVAKAVTENNPECHLMVLLVDERPEEVTDYQRLVQGEVISSTFDRPPSDHTSVAELAVERAKRLVELGHDVVLLVDGLTRLGRAYNVAAPAGGRLLAGGVDAAALHPPKRFFGAARNVENGGSLTMLATAAADSGSAMDEAILEEVRPTASMELRLRAEVPERRDFVPVDPARSGTRHEELITDASELAVLAKLRRGLATMDERAAGDQLLTLLRGAPTNAELLLGVRRDPAWGGARA